MYQETERKKTKQKPGKAHIEKKIFWSASDAPTT